MSRVTVRNEGPAAVIVSLYRCREDGWGKEHREAVSHVHLAAGEERSLEVSGDTRGGGSTIEVFETLQ